ncbi:Trypsin-like peptidase domain-containing protein [Chryseobacterium ureilyticum]|uniref:Trypsin-like peptidase domain-containing protein n=1 Tax=Chryseobacterium ureilyticum TaxID=373668 RepID=A0A1N7PA82_9FLAO|nr:MULTISPECIES: serine protease [Flavobacteriales]SIT07545.1 Trypsin-like peptidase domain-containing protein [Chryseobacterium ureilyticum]
MNRIISSATVESSVVQIVYKNKESGTGFFITDNLIITAYHILLDSKIDENSIIVYSSNQEPQQASIFHFDEVNDICLLKVSNKNLVFLPLTEISIRINDTWNSFGFPYQGHQEGVRIFGSVNQELKNERYDFIVNCSNIESGFDYSGLSGAPIISSGRVIGVALQQLDDKIGAISINKISKLLAELSISVFKEQKLNELPSHFAKEISQIVTNYDFVDRLNNVIQNENNWILLEGNPGTGKTTNIATYTPEENSLLLGRYFTKVPNDERPKSLRISVENFLNWLEESISIEITGKLPPKSSEPFENRLVDLRDSFEALDEYLVDKNKVGLFFIDGLDEVEKLKDFLEIIPEVLSVNLRIILSCTTKNILPIDIRNKIDESQIVILKPLEIDLCEYYCENKFQGKVDYENIQRIAIKSEGHPLYLNYLINFILNSELIEDEDELKAWIENIPSISGDIENYYNVIWESIYEDNNKLWICLILSQLRQAVTEEDFFEILPEDIRRHYYAAIPKISHLIKNDKLEIYHNSFKDYVLKKLPLYKKQCNDIIAGFCENFPDRLYSVINLVYHNAMSSNPHKAIISCNQKWADDLAVRHVEPDFIIDDIKKAIDISIQLRKTIDLLRLLLLLQRIDFRYNSVWVEYAYEMAFALIAQQEYSNALKYLVRRNVLLVSISDATLFLQHFCENDAFDEAEILNNAIEREYRKSVYEGMKSSEGVTPSLFISKARSIILKTRADFDNAQAETWEFLNLFEVNPDTGMTAIGLKNAPLLKYVINHSTAWNNSFLARNFDLVLDIDEIIRDGEITIDNTWSVIYATSLLIYREELNGYNLPDFNTREIETKLSDTTENLLEKFGYVSTSQARRIIILSLLKSTTKPDLLRNIVDEYLQDERKTILRADNGVDVDLESFTNLCLKNNCLGFKDDTEEFTVKDKKWHAKTWEQDLFDLITEIYYFEGLVSFLKASNQLDKKKDFICNTLEKIVETINFNFDFRSYWDRGYQFPEKLMPELFKKLVHLFHEFDFENLTTFLDTIEGHTVNQLGLFSEGYRKSLCEIIHVLLRLRCEEAIVIPLLEIWKKHVLDGVQNRWERTADLLKITEVYALLNLQDQSKEIFQEMLNTSMGPTWYKESQLMLINVALENFKEAPDSTLADYASILDQASGEMTFQRYVRNSKEEFIGSLIENQHVQKALDYYKFELLPPPNILNQNAELSDFDAPRLGDGYTLGAKNISDTNSILVILNTIDCNPYLKLALCEIFTINDDISRYSYDFGKQIGNVLNEIDNVQDGNFDKAFASVAILIADEEIDIDSRRQLLRELGSTLSSANIIKLRECLKVHHINWAADYDPEEHKTISHEKEKDSYDIFNDSLNDVRPHNKLDKIKEGLQVFENDQRSIWMNNWSTSTDAAKANIKKLFEDQESVVHLLGSNILNFDNEYWYICQEMMAFLQGKLDHQQVVEIHEIVGNHFKYIIRPTSAIKEKYKWIEKETTTKNNDHLVVEFIIWHLNHPVQVIRNKTMNVLERLPISTHNILKILFETCISDIPKPSTELCSYIIKNIAINSPNTIKEFLNQNIRLIPDLAAVQHLTIKKNLLDISIELNRVGFADLYLAIKSILPNTIILTGKVTFEDDSHLAYIHDIIDDLNSQMLLNSQFSNDLDQFINEFCRPEQKENVKRSDRYLRRSFPEQTMIEGTYNEIVRHSLNKALCKRVSADNIEELYKIVNYV